MAMVKQAERRAATRTAILDAAEQLFAEKGFEGTSTDAILSGAGISRGALYHHFETKQAVFEAVFLRASDAAIERALRTGRTGPDAAVSPLESLIQVCFRWLREVRKPVVAAIVIEQGPQVLGWSRARDLEAGTSLGLMMRGLERAEDAGEIKLESVELAARYLNAVLAEAALAARHRPPGVTHAGIERSLRQVIEGMAS
ncbi:MAG: TetR family transcriptional regulator [Myxococcota bacterium]